MSMRGFLGTPASAALLLCLGAPVAPALAAHCDGSSDPCTIDLGRASASFASGAASYFAEAVVVNGSDMSLSANPQLLSVTQITHGATGDSLVVNPQIYAYVGGSGIQGLHEVSATLQFTGLSFTADPGYQITSVQAIVKGSFSLVGSAYGGIGVPGAVQWTPAPNFTSTWSVDPASADVTLGFTAAASYLEGEEGTATSYGAASASIDSLEFVVTVAPVPEPHPAALLGVGGALLLLSRGRRR